MQVLLSKGISEDDLEAELEEKLLEVDRMRTYDEGVNSVLVASAADEIASLRSQIAQQADEIEQLKDRCGSCSSRCNPWLPLHGNAHRTTKVFATQLQQLLGGLLTDVKTVTLCMQSF